MNLTFDHLLLSSFKEYLDHKVVEKLAAWKNSVVPLFLDTEDDRLSGYKKASCGPQQWLYDSSIGGAVIASPSSFSGDWVNAKTDFKNSRFIVPQNATGIAPTSGLLATKHFNCYVTSKDDEDLFQNTVFDFEPEMAQKTKASHPDSYHAPCFFIKLSSSQNKGFAFGGLDKTIMPIKVTCFTKTEAELLALGSVFRDLNQTTTMILNRTPLNEFNDLKDRPWNFHNEISSAINSGNSVIYINKSTFNPLKSDNLNSKLKNIYVGLANIEVFVARYPRA